MFAFGFVDSWVPQSGQDDDEEDVAVDETDYLNEDELAELQRDEENIMKEVLPVKYLPSREGRLDLPLVPCCCRGAHIG